MSTRLMFMSSQQLGLLMPHPPIIVEGVSPQDRMAAGDTIRACEAAADVVRAFRPDTLIIVTPHGPVFRDAVALMAPASLTGDLSRFGARNARVSAEVDQELARAVAAAAEAEGLPMLVLDEHSSSRYRIRLELDHGALVPLSFIMGPGQPAYRLLHITYGLLPGETLFRIGQAIRRAADGLRRRIAFIASGDLSHRLKESGPYGFDPAGPPLDRQIVDALSGPWADRREALAALFHLPDDTLEHAAECGLRSIQTLLGFLDADPVTGRCLSYEGPFGVGYGVCIFETMPGPAGSGQPVPSLLTAIEGASASLGGPGASSTEPDASRAGSPESAPPSAHPYVRLARQSLEHYLKTGSRLKPPTGLDPALFGIRRGCFVSIHVHGHDGELRGCIGTMQPTAPSLAQEIINNAISAGVRDPRFPPVEQHELPALHFSVDVLSELEPTTRDQLDPKRYGVLVRYGGRSGVLLPDLEGVDTVDYQLAVALSKGGIRQSDPYTIERFTVDRYPEPD